MDENGRRGKEWIRCYAELVGATLWCWKAGSCSPDTASIERLKCESVTNTDIEFRALEIRMSELEALEDFSVDRTTHNAFSVNYSRGADKIHFMAVNSTLCKEWKASILRATKEAYVLDQRYTASLLALPSAPLYSEKMLPDPPLLPMKWPASRDFSNVYLCVEAKKGLKHRNVRGNRSFKCIYLYSDRRFKSCVARLMKITAIYAHAEEERVECQEFDFVIEGEGKLKSSKVGGLKKTTRAWFRAPTSELRVRWIALLRNAFELCTPPNFLTASQTELLEGDRSRHSTPSSTSDNSMISNPFDSSRFVDVRKPWDRRSSGHEFPNSPLGVSSPRGRTFSYPHDDPHEDHNSAFLLTRQRQDAERRRQYELYNSQNYRPTNNLGHMGIFNGFSMPFMGPIAMPMGMPQLLPMGMQMVPPIVQPMVQPYSMEARSARSSNSPRTSKQRPPLRHSISHHSFEAYPPNEQDYDPSNGQGYAPHSGQSYDPPNEQNSDRLNKQSSGPSNRQSSDSAKHYFQSYLSSYAEVRHGSVTCVALQEHYENYCRYNGYRAAKPSEAQKWMIEMGFVLNKEKDGPSWMNVILKD